MQTHRSFIPDWIEHAKSQVYDLKQRSDRTCLFDKKEHNRLDHCYFEDRCKGNQVLNRIPRGIPKE